MCLFIPECSGSHRMPFSPLSYKAKDVKIKLTYKANHVAKLKSKGRKD